jgi:hypothetical protein
MQRRRAFLLLRTDQPHVVELRAPSISSPSLANIAFARSLWPWAATAANGRVRAMSAEVRILALRHQREIGFLP